MEFRIDRGGFSPLGEVGRYSSAQISQQIRTRPTCHEIEALRQQVQDGLYSVDPGQIAARMLLQGKD